jgi:hypothetical protein
VRGPVLAGRSHEPFSMPPWSPLQRAYPFQATALAVVPGRPSISSARFNGLVFYLARSSGPTMLSMGLPPDVPRLFYWEPRVWRFAMAREWTQCVTDVKRAMKCFVGPSRVGRALGPPLRGEEASANEGASERALVDELHGGSVVRRPQFRFLSLVDDFSRESLTVEID